MAAPAVVDEQSKAKQDDPIDFKNIQQWLSLAGLVAFAGFCRQLLKEQNFSKAAIQARIVKALKAGKGLEMFEQGFFKKLQQHMSKSSVEGHGR